MSSFSFSLGVDSVYSSPKRSDLLLLKSSRHNGLHQGVVRFCLHAVYTPVYVEHLYWNFKTYSLLTMKLRLAQFAYYVLLREDLPWLSQSFG